MQNKARLSVLVILIIHSLFVSGKEKRIEAALNEVTVYRSSAKESRNATAQLMAGQTEVIITEIPLSMNEKSLQVSVPGNANLISAQVRTNYIPEGNTLVQQTQTNVWLDSLRSLERDLRWIAEERASLQGESALMDRLFQQIDASSGYQPSNIMNSVNYYGEHNYSVRKKLFELSIREEELNEKRLNLQQQLESNGEIRTRAIKEIILKFQCDDAVQANINVSFLVEAAGWLPFYDVKVRDTSSPVQLTAKARIFQTTGYDWTNAEVTISTMQPSADNNRPLLTPRYVDYVTYRFMPTDSNQAFGITNMMQVDRTEPGKKIQQSEQLDQSVAGLPNFSFDPAESDISNEYTLDAKMTIISDGKENVAKLQEYTIPAKYRYHAVPKLDQSAFLIAQLSNIGSLNLLAGDANIFYGPDYIGQVVFNPRSTQDNMLISLGREERIVVRRVRTNAHESKKRLSDKEEEIFTYEMTIRNNKKQPIEIEILDQIPLSRKDEIAVELLDRGKADYNKTFGKLTWTLMIEPGKSKNVAFSYSISSPEGKQVEEIR
jgi:uncharacterized protein (TIGR02231 family)